MMKIGLILLFGGVVALSSLNNAVSQTEPVNQNQLPDVPLFFADALSFASEKNGMSRLDVYVDVGYDVLHFINEGDVYRAGYEVTVTVNDSLGPAVDEKSWLETIETKEYEKSISPRTSNLSQCSFTLLPGRYQITIQVSDSDTKKIARLKKAVTVRNYANGRFSLSDIMLVNSLKFEGGKRVVSPNIQGNVGNISDSFFVFFEAYKRLNVDSTLISVKVYNPKGIVVQQDSFYQKLPAEVTPCFRRLRIAGLTAGEYVVGAEAHPHQQNSDGSSVDAAAFSSRPFSLHWKGLPVSIVDLDLAIDQMQYMLNKDELERMKKAEGERKREMFMAYWKRRDPSPNTERNELMEEYYSRVEYVNKHFGHYVDGWRSDMGMVYIIFGVPSNIERHPFDIDAKPYEIWTYYELNREFVFIDQSGFGDFKLQNPIWDIWRNRPR